LQAEGSKTAIESHTGVGVDVGGGVAVTAGVGVRVGSWVGTGVGVDFTVGESVAVADGMGVNVAVCVAATVAAGLAVGSSVVAQALIGMSSRADNNKIAVSLVGCTIPPAKLWESSRSSVGAKNDLASGNLLKAGMVTSGRLDETGFKLCVKHYSTWRRINAAPRYLMSSIS
jgi:hypothetical protein